MKLLSVETDELRTRRLSYEQKGYGHAYSLGAEGNVMSSLQDKNVVVIGGSRGLGRVIVEAALSEGARTLAVARHREALDKLSADLPTIAILAIDATREDAPERVFAALTPDLLVIAAGAIPPGASLQDQSWSEFSVNWETDVKASFLFCKAALRAPLAPGTKIVLISSGAGIGGSPISGGYAGSKRMQMFMANYCQKESDRHNLGLRFVSIAPGRIMPETDLGKAAVDGYSRYLGVSPSDFIKGMDSAQTPNDVAKAVITFATSDAVLDGNAFVVAGDGMKAVA